jgi:ubiquinone/menaquinone biosynthesis C-methylase UbiE
MYNRNLTIIFHYFLENYIPPVLRDRKWFMRPIVKLAYGSTTEAVLNFKDKYPFMSEDEISAYYELIKDAPINKRATDLNSVCLQYILDHISGESVLDAGCGRGALLKKIRAKYPAMKLCGTDLVLYDYNDQDALGIDFVKSNLFSLPFDDNSFDSVFCTHTLEHIRDSKNAISELLRVANKRLIIVVPKQREYRFTTDLHINFFPYLYSFKAFIGIEAAKYIELKGDFICIVDK